jgi:hypothetical protein
LQPVAVGLNRGEARAQRRQRVRHLAGRCLLQRQKLGQLGNLRVQLLQDRVAARDFLAEEKLNQREDR